MKNSFLEHRVCTGAFILKIRFHLALHRKTGDKIDDAIGELSSTGNENVIHHFECILLHLLLCVPLIAFDQQHKPFPGSQSFLVIMASKIFASFNFGKDIFCRGK